MEIMIEHLNKSYGKQTVLNDIRLHIPVGMYGLLGENGAGKTTLMRILSTMLEPTSGDIKINGVDIKDKKNIRKIIGYLPQEFSIYPNMSVYSALDYLGILAELPKKVRKERIEYLLKQVNLEQEKNKRFKNLATVYKGNIIKNLIMDCQSYTKYRPNETTGGIFVSWRRKEELPTGA